MLSLAKPLGSRPAAGLDSGGFTSQPERCADRVT